MPTKLTNKIFIERSKSKFGERFGYADTIYDGRHKKLILNCPTHGKISISPTLHLSEGHSGCIECHLENSRDDLQNFIKKARSVHGEKYDYTNSHYVNSRTKLEIYCLEHGFFEQTPNAHIYSRNGCPKCGFNAKVESLKHSKFYDRTLNHIYILEISNDNESFIKIGITKQSPLKRIEHIKCTSGKKYKPKLIWSTDKTIETWKAVEIENIMSEMLSDIKYVPNFKFDGYTECYLNLDINSIIASLEVAIQDKEK